VVLASPLQQFEMCQRSRFPLYRLLLRAEEPDSGPYYTHLGVAATLPELRATLEQRTGVKGSALRIEKARYCQKEGKSKHGCPIAKYVSGGDERMHKGEF